MVKNLRFSLVSVVFSGFAFSINDIAIKYFTDLMPLHEVVLFRAIIALIFTLAFFLPFEGGWRALKTQRPFLHILMGLCLVVANLTFFSALATIPLADCTAIFFIAPILITAISALFLNEKVGIRRWLALMVGMIGVLLIIRPGSIDFEWTILLPLMAAITYSVKNIITRKIGITETAVTMSFFLHLTFIIACLIMGLIFGDGAFSGNSNPAAEFIFRAWILPTWEMFFVILLAGVSSAFGGYFISQAYRYSSASIIAPFEYLTLVLAIFWGYLLWEELPDSMSFTGIFLIIGSGIFVALREHKIELVPTAKRLSARR